MQIMVQSNLQFMALQIPQFLPRFVLVELAFEEIDLNFLVCWARPSNAENNLQSDFPVLSSRICTYRIMAVGDLGSSSGQMDPHWNRKAEVGVLTVPRRLSLVNAPRGQVLLTRRCRTNDKMQMPRFWTTSSLYL